MLLTLVLLGVPRKTAPPATTTADLVHELTATWEQQQLPAEEKVRLLTMLLNEAAPTPALMRNYDRVLAKMQSQLPLVKLNNRGRGTNSNCARRSLVVPPIQ